MKKHLVFNFLSFLLLTLFFSSECFAWDHNLSFEAFYGNEFKWGWSVIIAVIAGIGAALIVYFTGGTASPIVAPIGTWIGEMAGLSGAAATNYGLALLGGGSLASGGLGVTGGMAILTLALTFSSELAIDYGIKRIGTAISDPLNMFPIPLKTIENDRKLWNNLEQIFSEYTIVKVICGYPVKEDNSKSAIADNVEKFAQDFKAKFKIDIEFVDERYSSSIAWEHIIETVPSQKKRRNKSLIDMKAAAVILDDYMKNQ